MKQSAIRKVIFFTTLMSLSAAQSVQAKTQIFQKEYDGFTLFLDCQRHGVVAFEYEIGKNPQDEDINAVSLEVVKDATVPETCQPGSINSYRNTGMYTGGQSWNRAFMVSPELMNNNTDTFKDAHLLTNTLPQSSLFNTIKGAWNQTDKIIQCYRDITDLIVWGGAIWGSDVSNDYFIRSHGIATPDYYWKVIYRKDTGDYIAWLFPNNKTTVADNLDDYLISLTKLMNVLDYIPDMTKYIETDSRGVQHIKSWNVFNNFTALSCDGQRMTRR